jgi:hypothetical protein
VRRIGRCVSVRSGHARAIADWVRFGRCITGPSVLRSGAERRESGSVKRPGAADDRRDRQSSGRSRVVLGAGPYGGMAGVTSR